MIPGATWRAGDHERQAILEFEVEEVCPRENGVIEIEVGRERRAQEALRRRARRQRLRVQPTNNAVQFVIAQKLGVKFDLGHIGCPFFSEAAHAANLQ